MRMLRAEITASRVIFFWELQNLLELVVLLLVALLVPLLLPQLELLARTEVS